MKSHSTMRNAARLVALAAATQLAGCWAVFIPGSLIDKAVGAPAYCARPTVRVGDMLTTPDGVTRRVTRVVGDSPFYCRNQPEGRRTGIDAERVASEK